jgi:hypothetical protein
MLVGELPISLRLLGVRVSDFPKQIAPADEHQRTLSQFFGNSRPSPSSSVSHNIDENEQDIFEDGPVQAKTPVAPKRNPIESMFASASQRPPKKIDQASASQLDQTETTADKILVSVLESQVTEDDDDLVLVSTSSSTSKKREAHDSLAAELPQAKRQKVPAVPKRKGQPTLETFLRPGK